MIRQSVSSTTIASVGYDRGARVVEIEFTDGVIFRYSPVPVYIFRELLDAPSVDAFVASVIRPRFKSEGPIRTTG